MRFMSIEMNIAITGTPGTGKSTVAPLVADQLRYDLIDLNEFVEEPDLSEGNDEERNSAMVDPDALNAALDDALAPGTDYVLESHMAHHMDDLDLVIVLRASPEELTERLEQKKAWDEDKIEENVMAERLDSLLQEASSVYPDLTFEVDTTDRDPETVAEEIVYLVEHPEERSLYVPGGTEWDMDEL